MSRVRMAYALGCFGILITTGGCAESATAPEAASYEFATDRYTNPTDADNVAAEPAAPAAPGGDEVYSTSSGYMVGGGRVDN